MALANRCPDCYGRMYESPEIHPIVCPARPGPVPNPRSRAANLHGVDQPTRMRPSPGAKRKPPAHGTRARYVSRTDPCHGVECGCLRANREYLAEYRLRRRKIATRHVAA